jgi:hypothetical protein
MPRVLIVDTRCYFGKHVSVALTYDSPCFMAVITHCHCSAVRALAPWTHAWFITSCFRSLFHRSWLALSSIASIHSAVDWSGSASVQPHRFKEKINASAQMKDYLVMTAVSILK